ncbi:MAG: heavy metal translocating P-type ATPase [Chloroflexi bacterium]|nr:heavy metal translocating P-type ATPase [Chloroflexota bacterium]MCY3581239.1 heavy metal translocating P-type ATPase [Chloroflexota bacterium]MCY3716646.1 heavy metal translocating P-type ATPase [Chloroflexota bacterium]MDE2651693.1 heavy metal translocating P-type ATPase [Chloroflexota bacterium]MXX81963.1 copper-translocating P-type ATPase [Chloroflexota bacterium]
MSSRQITLPVTGMTCAMCAGNVERALKRADGVQSATVNLATEEARVAYETSAVSPADLAARLERAGYGVVAASIDLAVTGMTCAMCAGNVERALKRVNGVLEVAVNLANDSASLSYLPTLARTGDFARALEQAGYGIIDTQAADAPEDAEAAARRAETTRQERLLLIGAIFTIPLTILSMARHFLHQSPFLSEHFAWLHDDSWLFAFGALATPVVFALGRQYVSGGLKSLRNGSANMDVLVAMGSLAAYGYGLIVLLGILLGFSDVVGKSDYFESAAVILTLITLGKLLEARAKSRTSAAIKQLIKLAPKTATLLRDDQAVEIPIDEVIIGDKLLVKPGERLPVDALVLDGSSAVDESLLTGESLPIDKSTGDEVIAGSINQQGRLVIEAQRIGKDTMLAQMIELVMRAQASKAPIQAAADRVAAYFVPVVILLAVITLLGWLFIGAASFPVAMLNMIAVLVIACPCALGLATPTAIMVGGGRGAEQGILFRDSEALERSAGLTAVLLDKTGTITQGKPELTALLTTEKIAAECVLQYAASAEAASEHPLAQAVLSAAAERELGLLPLDEFAAHPGRGIVASIDGVTVTLGSPRFLRERGINLSALNSEITQLQARGQTVVLLALKGELAGALALGDTLKPSAKAAVQTLQNRGLQVTMISGDNQQTAAAIASELDIQRVLAEVLPADKAAAVQQLQRDGKRVAMVGDGVNDAPALAQADVGFAIGAGADIAIEAADVTLVSGDLRALPTAIDLSKATLRTIHQNLFWAFIYNIVLIPVAMLGLLIPMFAAAAMAFSSVFVVSNSLRLRGRNDHLKSKVM